MGDVRTERTGPVGWITLNRPRVLNALSHSMIREITTALNTWVTDDGVETVVLTGAGDRGLCAGGDIRAIHDDARAGGAATEAFWRDEYRLNALVARYPKPYLAVLDGIAFGGGVGLGAHASHRVVTERTRIAMPEAGIGLIPDVGATWLLARAPGELGTHAILTGDRLGPGDALALGLADAFVPSARLPALLASVPSLGPDAALRRFAEPAPEPELAASREWIDHCYAATTVEEIIDRLTRCGATDAVRAITAASPTCVKVALEAIRRAGRCTSLEQVLDQEFRTSLRGLAMPDALEGIRARVLDKDHDPRWDPSTLDAVDGARVAAFFAPLEGTAELGLAGRCARCP